MTEKLQSYGLEPKKVGKAGITALIGKGEPCILLRADMDSLPMQETSGLDFAATNGHCHSCGHDTHTSMLLLAAKMLKENEVNLKGTVKLMFQPAEEILQGSLDMIENGILENPKVDAAVAMHVFMGEKDTASGSIRTTKGMAMSSADAYTITVKGKSSHGSMPELGVDAVITACHIAIALQNITSREISMFNQNVVLVGKISGGDTPNTTPGHAKLEVTTRSNSEESRAFLEKRINEISKGIAETFRATVEITHNMGSPTLYNNPELVEDLLESAKNIVAEDKINLVRMSSGTEDFAFVALKVPSALIQFGVGSIDEGYKYGVHNSSMTLNEDSLPTGVALYAQFATEYLNKHGN